LDEAGSRDPARLRQDRRVSTPTSVDTPAPVTRRIALVGSIGAAVSLLTAFVVIGGFAIIRSRPSSCNDPNSNISCIGDAVVGGAFVIGAALVVQVLGVIIWLRLLGIGQSLPVALLGPFALGAPVQLIAHLSIWVVAPLLLLYSGLEYALIWVALNPAVPTRRRIGIAALLAGVWVANVLAAR
jgi:hypothetical protein